MQQLINKMNPMRLIMGIMLLGVLAWGCGEAEEAEEPVQEEMVAPAPEPIEAEPTDTTKTDTTAEQRPVNRN